MRRLTSILAAILLAACASAPAYPPLVTRSTGRYRPGTFVWTELFTSDVETAKRFYGEVFGWTFDARGEYTLVRNGGRPIGGIVAVPRDGAGDDRWIPSLSVPDPYRSARDAAAAGGEVLDGPFDLEGRGRYAIVADPQGATLILLRAQGGDPVPAVPSPGDWLFHVLWSTDPEGALDFYGDLTGWTRRRLESPGAFRYWLAVKDTEWKAGVAGVEGEDEEALWLPDVLVTDVPAIVARAIAAGGEVLLGPERGPSDGNTALIADPGGAVFLVETWPSPSKAEGGR